MEQGNALLDLAKLEAGRVELSYGEIDVTDLVLAAVNDFAGVAAENAIEFVVQVDGPIIAQVDAEKLQRVLLNLLSNALRFTPRRGRVRCALIVTGEAITLEVADSGSGVPVTHRRAVFERFQQVEGDPTHHPRGTTGLGLAIARDFVELHRGTITIGDAPEGGALFTVNIPRWAPTGISILSAPAPSHAMKEASRRTVLDFQIRSEPIGTIAASDSDDRPLVLVVEDNLEMNRFIRESLSADYRTAAAFDGAEGLRKTIELHPDLIVSDVMMPEATGDRLARELRSRTEFIDTPIVLLTAKTDQTLRVDLLRMGATDYVMKPFSAAEVRTRIRNLINVKLANERNRVLLAELQERHEALGRVTAELESTNKELETFSYSASHDLRAPLRTIDGFSSALLEDYGDQLGQQGQDYLGRIRAAAQHMAQLIDDLLRLSRVTRTELRYERIDLTALATAVADELGRAAPEQSVRFVVQSGLSVVADAHLMQIVLENLMGNAWKFTSRSSGTLVEFGSVTRDGQLTFLVRDNGVGFDMAHAGRLFGAFQRLHSEAEFQGTGIGLATVRRIVERHGGRIWAEAAPDAGATFYWTLPGGSTGVSPVVRSASSRPT